LEIGFENFHEKRSFFNGLLGVELRRDSYYNNLNNLPRKKLVRSKCFFIASVARSLGLVLETTITPQGFPPTSTAQARPATP
jgi:hypothetical protein